MTPSSCIILSSAFPDDFTGTGYAVQSILPTVTSIFGRVNYIAVAAEEVQFEADEDLLSSVKFHHPLADTAPKWQRFLKSVFSKWPGTVQRYRNPGVLDTLRTCLGEEDETGTVIMVMDSPLYWPLLGDKELRKRFARVILWSHNVAVDAFEGLLPELNPLARACWKWEIQGLRKYEGRVLADTDVLWTITKEDRDSYRELYRIEADEVFGIRIRQSRFEQPIQGDVNTLLYLGSFDIRKSVGIRKFVSTGLPALREKSPAMSLVLGGKGSEAFACVEEGVRGEGFVEDENAFMARGLIFVNPQESGSGLKLKSLHAMAAGKVLVTTPIGAQGIPGTPGVHFLVGGDAVAMAGEISRHCSDPDSLHAIATQARALIREQFSEEAFDHRAAEIFREIFEETDVVDSGSQ